MQQPCEEPQRPDSNKSLNDNGEALADLAIKFRECSAWQAKLAGRFDLSFCRRALVGDRCDTLDAQNPIGCSANGAAPRHFNEFIDAAGEHDR
jgi:hypothetical protein